MGFVYDPETGLIREEGDIPASSPLPRPGGLAQALTTSAPSIPTPTGGDPFTGRTFEYPSGPATAAFNPETGEIDLTPTPPPKRTPEEIMAAINQAREVDARFQGQPIGGGDRKFSGAEPGIGAMPGPEGAAPKDFTPTTPEEGGLSPEKRAMLLRLMSGLTEAGRQMQAAPSYFELMHGVKTSPEFRPETQLSGAAERIEAEQRAKRQEKEAETKAVEEGKASPVVAGAKPLAETMGLDPERVKTEKQAEAIYRLAGQEEKLKLLRAQRGAIEAKTTAVKSSGELAAEMAARRASGDISALPQEIKDKLTDAETRLSKEDNYRKYIQQAEAATSIRTLLEQGGELAIRGMPVILARAMGEVGNLSKTEQDAYRKLLGIKGEISAWEEWWTSTPSAERLAAMAKLADAFQTNAVPKVENAINRHAGAFIRKYSDQLPEQTLRDHFFGFAAPGSVSEVKGGADTMDLIMIGGEYDGKPARNVPRTEAEKLIREQKARPLGE
jgi:hypothetical protein